MIRPALAGTALVLAASAHAASIEDPGRWRSHALGSLRIVTDASESKVEEIARQLAIFRAVLEDTTSSLRFDSVVPTTLVAFRDADDLPTPRGEASDRNDFRGWHVGSEVAGQEAFIVTTTTPRQTVEFTRRFKRFGSPADAAVHEYVHHVLAASFPKVPVWLNEGIATFYMTFWAGNRTAEIGRPHPSVLSDARGIDPVPMADLFALGERPDGPPVTVPQVYGQSWAIVHYLLRGSPERRESFGRFLTLLRQGREQREAWNEAFHAPPDTVRDEAFRYVRRGVFRVREYQIGTLRWERLGEARPVPAGELLGLLAKIRFRFEDLEGAEARAVAALAADPSEPRALYTLAAIRAQRLSREEAIALGERALRAARGRRELELEASLLLDALGEGERAREILDGAPAPPQP